MASTGANDRSGLEFPVLDGFSLEHFYKSTRLLTARRARLLPGEYLHCHPREVAGWVSE
jgi:hypothetical protein